MVSRSQDTWDRRPAVSLPFHRVDSAEVTLGVGTSQRGHSHEIGSPDACITYYKKLILHELSSIVWSLVPCYNGGVY